MNKFTLRKVRPDDADALCTIHRNIWMKTYVSDEHRVTIEALDAYTSHWVSEENKQSFRKLIDSTNNTEGWLVAEYKGQAIGHIKTTEKKGSVYIDMFYVSPDRQGEGVGSALFNSIQDIFGDTEYFVDVVSYNYTGINFYKHRGFSFYRNEPNSAKPLPSGKPLPLIRLRLKI